MVIFSWPLFGLWLMIVQNVLTKCFHPWALCIRLCGSMTFLRTPCDFKRKKKWGKKSEKEESWGEKVKSDNQDCCVIFLNPKTISKFCFLCMPELCKLIFCIWIRRPRSVRPVNSFVLSFSSLQHDSDQKTTRLDSKCKISKGEWVNQLNSLAD